MSLTMDFYLKQSNNPTNCSSILPVVKEAILLLKVWNALENFIKISEACRISHMPRNCPFPVTD